MMVAGDPVELLPWDTEFWGVRAARLHLNDLDQLAVADREADRLGIEWASALVPVAETDLVNAAVGRGHRIVDVRYSLRMSFDGDRPKPVQTLATESDADVMANIARSAFSTSRFYADPHLDDARCAEFYDRWVHNSFNGQMADAVVASRIDAVVDGFITVRLRSDGSATLSLVAVREDRRGFGVGRRLLDTTLDWIAAQGVHKVEVVTQLSNVSAIRLYEAAGFRTTDASVWLHRWYGR